MALVSDGFELVVTLVDSGDNKSNKRYILNAADAATAATDAGTIMTRLTAITNAVIGGYGLTEKFVEDAFVYPTDIEIENRALVIGRIDGEPSKTWTETIPAPIVGIFVAPSGPSRNEIDITNTALVTYMGTFNATQALAEVSDGEQLADVSTIKSGHRAHRKSNYG